MWRWHGQMKGLFFQRPAGPLLRFQHSKFKVHFWQTLSAIQNTATNIDKNAHVERTQALSILLLPHQNGCSDFCIKRPKFPRVTHGKDLCKTRHWSLTYGRNYVSPNLHKTLIIYDWWTISREGFMQNAKRVGTLSLVCDWLLQLSHSL